MSVVNCEENYCINDVLPIIVQEAAAIFKNVSRTKLECFSMDVCLVALSVRYACYIFTVYL